MSQLPIPPVDASDYAAKALTQAGHALSEITLSSFSLTKLDVLDMDLADVPDLLGDTETLVTAAFFGVTGDLCGYLLFILSEYDSELLLEKVLGEEPSSPELADSTLGEIGNIVGCSFLNYLADYYRLRIVPTPPQIIRDMAGALMSTIAGGLASHGLDHTRVLRSEWSGQERSLSLDLLWLPYTDLAPLHGGRTV